MAPLHASSTMASSPAFSLPPCFPAQLRPSNQASFNQDTFWQVFQQRPKLGRRLVPRALTQDYSPDLNGVDKTKCRVSLIRGIRASRNKGNVEARAAEPAQSAPTSKTKSILCSQCNGNGAVVCSQCNGDGINSVDHFDGRFKAGTTCWLCRGKKEMLCGNCNGAGFLGGFLNAMED